MKRPTIALCMIVKNEAINMPRLLESIEGCFDEIHITDTGSTDKTIEVIKNHCVQVTNEQGPPNLVGIFGAPDKGASLYIHNFEWCDDFAAARNYSFSHSKADFLMWMDADDILSNKEDFIRWRNDCMWTNDYWFANYDYSVDELTGKVNISFARERVIRNGLGLKWEYFVHEGIPPASEKKVLHAQTTVSWKIIHKRTQSDIQKDKFRNIKIFEANMKKGPLPVRMVYYLGKEYFEAQKPMQAFPKFMEAISDQTLDQHDRILGIQYACYSLMACNQYEQAVPIAFQGLQLVPNRAEYFVIIGDCLLKMNKLREAIPFYSAAKNCFGVSVSGDDNRVHATFNYPNNYQEFPRQQLAQIYYSLGEFDLAKIEAEECIRLFKDEGSKEILKAVNKAVAETYLPIDAKIDKAVVLTTPPFSPYHWDEDIAKVKGMGGSETAAIEMMKWIKKLTGWAVKIYNVRDDEKTCESGVEYLPTSKLAKYFSENIPAVHIAWRHNNKLSNGPTYLWCHDLVTQGVEQARNFTKHLCLSPFHSRFVQGIQRVPESEIMLTRNGIDPERFKDKDSIAKNPNKIIWPSSPDRGLERAIKIVEKAREKFPDLELHVFYGFENLYKYGKAEQASRILDMIRTRPWIKNYGFTQQNELAKHFMESVVWLYPASFIESFCITALEALCSGCYPLVRDIGALPDTLREASEAGMATVLDLDCETDEEVSQWGDVLCNILNEKKWEKVVVDPNKYSWESVAKEWIEWLRPHMEG